MHSARARCCECQGGPKGLESGGVIGDFLKRDLPVKRALGTIFRLTLECRDRQRGEGAGALEAFGRCGSSECSGEVQQGLGLMESGRWHGRQEWSDGALVRSIPSGRDSVVGANCSTRPNRARDVVLLRPSMATPEAIRKKKALESDV